MCRIAQIEPIALVAAFIEKRVRPNGDGQRLMRALSRPRLGFSSEDPRDVDLERKRRRAAATRRSDANRLAAARGRQLRVGDFLLRLTSSHKKHKEEATKNTENTKRDITSL